MNARINNNKTIVREGEQTEIGGNEKYVSLCRKHWWPEKSTIAVGDMCEFQLINYAYALPWLLKNNLF